MADQDKERKKQKVKIQKLVDDHLKKMTDEHQQKFSYKRFGGFGPPKPTKPTEVELTEAQNKREEYLKKLKEEIQKERLELEEEQAQFQKQKDRLAQQTSDYKDKLKQLGLDEFGKVIPEAIVKAVKRAIIETPSEHPAKPHIHDENIVEMKKIDREAGNRLVVFKHSFAELMEAITHDEVIKHAVEGDINLREELQNPKFKFITVQSPRLSRLAANALSAQTQHTKALFGHELSKKGVEKRNNDADQYAVKMYEVISRLKREEQITTYRETVKSLNENKVPTFREGGEWHLSTLQNLQKRWKELGLTPAPKPK